MDKESKIEENENRAIVDNSNLEATIRELMPTSEEFYADAKAEFGEVVEWVSGISLLKTPPLQERSGISTEIRGEF